MFVKWSLHAQEKFAERILLLGLNYGDIEVEVVKQKVKICLNGDKFKSIMCISGKFVTVIKIDLVNRIHVLTLWESSVKEVDEWKQVIVQFANQNPN